MDGYLALKSMGIEPVGGCSVAGGELDFTVIDALHFLDDDALHAVQFAGDDVKVEFVMHLQNHFGLDALLLESSVDAHHSQLDDVGSGALDGRVDGIALAEASHYSIPGVDVR